MAEIDKPHNQPYQNLLHILAERQQEAISSEQTILYAEINASQDNFMETSIEGFNRAATPFMEEQKTLKERSKKRVDQVGNVKTSKVSQVTAVRALAQEFNRRNPELDMRKLLLLLDELDEDDTPEEILKKIRNIGFEDPTLIDTVLEFLSKATGGKLAKAVIIAREKLNKDFTREIRAGVNIGDDARNYSDMGMGTPTDLRNLYRDITGNPRETTTLFEQLSEKYSPKEMQTTIEFLLHSMGNDMKAEGPSIERAKLHRLMTEVRSLQAILGVHKFFESRMNLIGKLFQTMGAGQATQKPEILAKIFVQFISNRYPTSDKLLRLAKALDVENNVEGQIVLFSQYRDAIRQTSIRLYQSQQHRDQVYMAILEALEELEKILDEEAEEEDEDYEEEEDEDNLDDIKTA